MMIGCYIVETTQTSLTVTASSLAAAIEQVLDYELCPLSAIVSVATFDSEGASA